MLTREQAYEIIANYEYIMFGCNYGTAAGRELIDKIYDEHEAQMKALDDKYAEAVNLYESAVMEFHEQMKAKDEEIALLKSTLSAYAMLKD